MSVKVVVVDDEYLVRLGIQETIDWKAHGFEIVGEASDGRKGLELVRKYKPDIVLTDIRMPFMDGLELMARMREEGFSAKIVVLSGYAEFDYVKTAMDHGASTYLLKPIENEKLLKTMKQLAQAILEEQQKGALFSILKDELPVIRRQFFRDLMEGILTDWDEIREKAELLHLPLEYSHHYVVLMRLEELGDRPLPQIAVETEKISKCIECAVTSKLLLEGKAVGHFFEDIPGQWGLLIHPLHPSADFLRSLKDCLIEINTELEQRLDYHFCIGISRFCQDITQVRRAYLEAVKAAQSRPLPGLGFVKVAGEEDSMQYRREIRTAIQYIQEHYNEDITVEMIANELYMSPDHLMHLFKKEVGHTFNECLTLYRIEKAKQWLRNPQYKVYEVCEMAGYKDPKYFSQLFKRIVGQSPSEYAKWQD